MDSGQLITMAGLVRESYFPTLIYYVDVRDGAELNLSIMPHIYELRARDPAGIWRSNAKEMGAWHSTTDLADHQEFAPLAAAIHRAATAIFSDLGYDQTFSARIDSMWANINPKNAYNRSHTHPNTLWSGVYYVRAPEDCGRIVFREPRAQAQVILPFFPAGARRPELWTEIFFQAIAGRLILFPAWLQHDVEPNRSTLPPPDGERVSISFNIRQWRAQTPAGGTSASA